MEKTTIYNKLHEARKYIKTCGLKKEGWNDYSKYHYYTPEQISQLAFQACENQKLLTVFSLKRNDIGVYGELEVIDLEGDGVLRFEMATAIPEIKATNAAQQLGGAVTYTERYLLMTAFDIKDNNLDPDSKEGGDKQQKPESNPKQWLNKWKDKDRKNEDPNYWKIVGRAIEQGKKISDLREYYKISKEIEKELKADLK